MIFTIIYNCIIPIVWFFYRIFFFPSVYGKENVPKQGGFIISGNHQSNHDAPFIAAFMPRRMNFLAKKELFSTAFTNWFLKGIGAIPISRGNSEIGALKLVISILKNGKIISVFPEGTRSNTNIEDAKSGAVLFAIKSKVPILPTKIDGKYKLWRKTNLIFGKPIYYDEYYDTKLSQEQLHELTISLMKTIYSLKGK